MTGCPGVVVVQECDEEGVDVAGGRLLHTIELQNFVARRNAACDWLPWRGGGAGV